MNMMSVSQNEPPGTAGFRVDVSRGQRIGRVSSEWFARPDDERYLNLPDLYDVVRGRAERAQARTVESRAIKVEASRDNPERLALVVPGRDESVAPTHWSFGQLCTLVGAPTSYMRQLHAALSAINLQHGLLSHRAELVKTLEARTDEDRETFLRKGGFSKSDATKIIETVLCEERRKPESIFDFVQGITAFARGKVHQDARLELEGKAKRLMERAI